MNGQNGSKNATHIVPVFEHDIDQSPYDSKVHIDTFYSYESFLEKLLDPLVQKINNVHSSPVDNTTEGVSVLSDTTHMLVQPYKSNSNTVNNTGDYVNIMNYRG